MVCEDFRLFEFFLLGEPSSLEAFWMTYNVFHFVLLKFSLLGLHSWEEPTAHLSPPPGEHSNSGLAMWLPRNLQTFEPCYLIKGRSASLILIGRSTIDPVISAVESKVPFSRDNLEFVHFDADAFHRCLKLCASVAGLSRITVIYTVLSTFLEWISLSTGGSVLTSQVLADTFC